MGSCFGIGFVYSTDRAPFIQKAEAILDSLLANGGSIVSCKYCVDEEGSQWEVADKTNRVQLIHLLLDNYFGEIAIKSHAFMRPGIAVSYQIKKLNADHYGILLEISEAAFQNDSVARITEIIVHYMLEVFTASKYDYAVCDSEADLPDGASISLPDALNTYSIVVYPCCDCSGLVTAKNRWSIDGLTPQLLKRGIWQKQEKGGHAVYFHIQTSAPKIVTKHDIGDVTLADAIETIFPMQTEYAYMIWNHVHIPLSYKYDISYMVMDALALVDQVMSRETGHLAIDWLPDTFSASWNVSWDGFQVEIHSTWRNVIGDVKALLNARNYLSLAKDQFVAEWKPLFSLLASALQACGYSNLQDYSYLSGIVSRL